MVPVKFNRAVTPTEPSGLEVEESIGYPGSASALVAINLRNLPGQKVWGVEQAHIIRATGAPVEVLSVQMKPAQLAPGEEGLVVVEVRAAPWTGDKPFSVVLVGPNGQRRLSFNLEPK